MIKTGINGAKNKRNRTIFKPLLLLSRQSHATHATYEMRNSQPLFYISYICSH